MIKKIIKAIKDFIDSKVLKKKINKLEENLKKFPWLNNINLRVVDRLFHHKEDTIFLKSMKKAKNLKDSMEKHIKKRIKRRIIRIKIKDFLKSLPILFSMGFIYELQNGFEDIKLMKDIITDINFIHKVNKENKKNEEWRNSYGDAAQKSKCFSWFAKTFAKDQSDAMKDFNKVYGMFGGDNPDEEKYKSKSIIDLDPSEWSMSPA